jgi:hypothetical protein
MDKHKDEPFRLLSDDEFAKLSPNERMAYVTKALEALTRYAAGVQAVTLFGQAAPRVVVGAVVLAGLGPQGTSVLDDDMDGVKEDGVRRRAYFLDPVAELPLRDFEACCEFGVSPY